MRAIYLRIKPPVKEIAQLGLVMGKPSHNRGFALIEVIITLFILSVLIHLSLRITKEEKDFEDQAFFDHYLYVQTESLLKNEVNYIQEDIWFNANGNINQARTLTLPSGRTYILELGGGRIVKKE